jgi:hypothetical protein
MSQVLEEAYTCTRVLRDCILNLRQCPENKHRVKIAESLLIYAGLFVEEHYNLIDKGGEPYDGMIEVLDLLRQDWIAEQPINRNELS